MHHHLEIIMPPTAEVEKAVTTIMRPHSENLEREWNEEEYNPNGWWDFWVIGGRWSGHKLKATLDKGQIDKFYEAMQEKKVTVSGITCGKQELQPASQIPMVDALWREYFPDGGDVCLLFSHSNDQYDSNSNLSGDITTVKDCPKDMTVQRILFSHVEPLGTAYMLTEDVWNGFNHMKTDWDGTISQALERQKESIERYADDYKAKYAVTDDWLAVTVDYHS